MKLLYIALITNRW